MRFFPFLGFEPTKIARKAQIAGSYHFQQACPRSGMGALPLSGRGCKQGVMCVRKCIGATLVFERLVTPFFKEMDMNFIKSFLKDDQGLETVEYAVMTALIVATIVTAIGALATAIEGRFGEVEGVVDGIN